MIESIQQCIETLERSILDLESGRGSAAEVMDMLGLSHVKLPSAQVIALLDMLSDGIAPAGTEVITAFLGVCEAQKKLLYALGGHLEKGAGILRSSAELESAAPSAAPVAAPVQELTETEKTISPQESAAPDGPAAEQHADPHDIQAQTAKTSISSIRVGTDRLDRLIELVGKLMVTYAVISQSGGSQVGKSVASLRELDSVIDRLKGEVEAIRLVPLRQIFQPMQRLVKSLSQKVGKKVRFEVEGEDLALDKTIVEYLNEPLLHLIRNAVDHGLEKSEERAMAGKDETGLVRLAAWRKGETAYLSVSDDGRGLNPQRIRDKAVEKGLMKESDALGDDEVIQFVLRSGFSTAEKITDVSGRGVGMDAVVNVIRNTLGGDILIQNEPGRGAAFVVSIPLSRSANEGIVDALVCRLGSEVFIIPSRDVVEIYVPRRNDLVQLPDGRETVDVRGEVHGLLRLSEYLRVPPAVDDITKAQTVVVRVGDQRAAILVDEVLRQQQVVVTGFTVPVNELFSLPILGFGMMGESDAMVINTELLLQDA